jgi:hypothetical protein
VTMLSTALVYHLYSLTEAMEGNEKGRAKLSRIN